MADSKRLWLLWGSIFFLILFISALIYAIFLYMDLNDKRTAEFEETTREILNQTAISEIADAERFYGEEAYHVIHGTNSDGEDKIIFYPLEGNEKVLTTINADDIISKETIISDFQSTCSNCSLVNVTPALIEEEALWELTYYDEQNRYVFEYVSIYDATPYEEIRYVRMFN